MLWHIPLIAFLLLCISYLYIYIYDVGCVVEDTHGISWLSKECSTYHTPTTLVVYDWSHTIQSRGCKDWPCKFHDDSEKKFGWCQEFMRQCMLQRIPQVKSSGTTSSLGQNRMWVDHVEYNLTTSLWKEPQCLMASWWTIMEFCYSH